MQVVEDNEVEEKIQKFYGQLKKLDGKKKMCINFLHLKSVLIY